MLTQLILCRSHLGVSQGGKAYAAQTTLSEIIEKWLFGGPGVQKLRRSPKKYVDNVAMFRLFRSDFLTTKWRPKHGRVFQPIWFNKQVRQEIEKAYRIYPRCMWVVTHLLNGMHLQVPTPIATIQPTSSQVYLERRKGLHPSPCKAPRACQARCWGENCAEIRWFYKLNTCNCFLN